jgi:hypothetical protein
MRWVGHVAQLEQDVIVNFTGRNYLGIKDYQDE